LDHRAGDPVYIGAAEEQLARSPGVEGIRPALIVPRDVEVIQEQLVAFGRRVRVAQRSPARAQRLDFGAGEDEAGVVGL
jgi:hypothetical protein